MFCFKHEIYTYNLISQVSQYVFKICEFYRYFELTNCYVFNFQMLVPSFIVVKLWAIPHTHKLPRVLLWSCPSLSISREQL